MTWELVYWLLCFGAAAGTLAIMVYQLLCLSDLELDFINLYDFIGRFNKWTVPEFAIHGTMAAAFLLFGKWVMFLLCTPLLYYNVKSYLKKNYLLDVTEVFQHINIEKKVRYFKMGFYLFLLVIIIYRVVLSAMDVIIDASIGSWDGPMLDIGAGVL